MNGRARGREGWLNAQAEFASRRPTLSSLPETAVSCHVERQRDIVSLAGARFLAAHLMTYLICSAGFIR
jgi:hypothetical protein